MNNEELAQLLRESQRSQGVSLETLRAWLPVMVLVAGMIMGWTSLTTKFEFIERAVSDLETKLDDRTEDRIKRGEVDVLVSAQESRVQAIDDIVRSMNLEIQRLRGKVEMLEEESRQTKNPSP